MAYTPAVSEEEFRALMRMVCGPVVVITTTWHGEPAGTTVSAFASLSLRPPMVLAALDKSSRLLSRISHSERFGVNILGQGQEQLALTFARKNDDKFAGVDWSLSGGLPRLADVPGWAACTVTRIVPGGDHMIVLGTVSELEYGAGDTLVYGHRAFGTHSPHVPPERTAPTPASRHDGNGSPN